MMAIHNLKTWDKKRKGVIALFLTLPYDSTMTDSTMLDIKLPYRIFAVDPAMGKSGWSVLDVITLDPLKIIIIAHGQYDGDKLFRKKKEMAERFQKQFCTLEALGDEYEILLDHYKPDTVVSESAFGYTHMSALISLTLAINELRRASKKILNQDIVTVPPTITKKSFTGAGNADKDHMRLAYQTNDYLAGIVSDDRISEHEIDAIAHGVGFIKRDILGTVVQVSAKDVKRAKLEKKRLKEAKLTALKE